MSRVPVKKTQKMLIGGAFVRSESGRVFDVPAKGATSRGGAEVEKVGVPLASRKDARDAVLAARDAAAPWASRAAAGRGEILYRLAEVMESRREELKDGLARGGERVARAAVEVDVAIDRVVYYAGFCDKFQALLASSNPVAGPYFSFSYPEATGVVAIVAPSRPALLGLVSTVLPVLAGGNTCVVVAGDEDPRTAVSWCECLATSDVPSGVVNVLTGRASELAPHLARHREVAAMDAWTADAELRVLLDREGSPSAKPVITHGAEEAERLRTPRGQGLAFVERFVQTKTLWHPAGT